MVSKSRIRRDAANEHLSIVDLNLKHKYEKKFNLTSNLTLSHLFHGKFSFKRASFGL